MNSERGYCNRYAGYERKKYIEYVRLHSQEIIKPPWFMSAYKDALAPAGHRKDKTHSV